MGTTFGNWQTIYDLYDKLASISLACEFGQYAIWTLNDYGITANLPVYDEEYGWGVKDVQEIMGPFVFDCPLEFLQKTEPQDEGWREEVYAYHEKQQARWLSLRNRLKREGKDYMNLLEAVIRGNVRQLQEYIRVHPEYINRHCKLLDGHAPLGVAVKFGMLMTARVLLDNGADVHALDELGLDAYQLANFLGDFEMMELLLSYSNDDENDDGQDPYVEDLMNACYVGDLAQLLQVEEAMGEEFTTWLRQPSGLFGTIGGFALYLATMIGRLQLVRHLLERSAFMETNPNNGETLLHKAVEGEQPGIIPLLVSYGAEVNAQDKKGNTPLHKAAQMGVTELAIELLAAGANPDLLNNMESTALDFARERNKTKVIEVLERSSVG